MQEKRGQAGKFYSAALGSFGRQLSVRQLSGNGRVKSKEAQPGIEFRLKIFREARG